MAELRKKFPLIHVYPNIHINSLDVGLTALGSKLMADRLGLPFIPTFIGVFVFGEIVHMMMGISTPVTRQLDLDLTPVDDRE